MHRRPYVFMAKFEYEYMAQVFGGIRRAETVTLDTLKSYPRKQKAYIQR
jgi:hypothetical protein